MSDDVETRIEGTTDFSTRLPDDDTISTNCSDFACLCFVSLVMNGGTDSRILRRELLSGHAIIVYVFLRGQTKQRSAID